MLLKTEEQQQESKTPQNVTKTRQAHKEGNNWDFVLLKALLWGKGKTPQECYTVTQWLETTLEIILIQRLANTQGGII